MQKEADIVKSDFESWGRNIPRQVQEYEKKAKRSQRLITGLSIFALIVFGATLIACAILGKLLYQYG